MPLLLNSSPLLWTPLQLTYGTTNLVGEGARQTFGSQQHGRFELRFFLSKVQSDGGDTCTIIGGTADVFGPEMLDLMEPWVKSEAKQLAEWLRTCA